MATLGLCEHLCGIRDSHVQDVESRKCLSPDYCRVSDMPKFSATLLMEDASQRAKQSTGGTRVGPIHNLRHALQA